MTLEIDSLCKTFDEVKAVNNVNISVQPGEFVGIIGRSGAGKSTLLRLINLLERPDGGSVRWKGSVVSDLHGKAKRAWRTECAMIFQDFGMIDRLDVVTNVLIGRLSSTNFLRSLFKSFPKEDRAQAVLELHRLGLNEFALQRANTLSGGQKQRVAIARAMMQSPSLLLADEPVSSLDPANTRAVIDALAQVNRERGTTILINLHDIDLATATCDRIIAMDRGRVVFDGPAKELTKKAEAKIFGLDLEGVAAE